jgi:fucose permease
MLVSLAVLTTVCLVVPLVPDFATIKLLFIVAGAGFAMIKVSVYATIGIIAPDRKTHASLMSFLESFFTGGVVFGYFLFGAFTDDANPGSTAWLNVFYVLAALSFLAWLLLLNARLDESALHRAHPPAWGEQIRSMLVNVVPVFAACVFLYVMLEQSTMNWLPSFNVRVLHLPARLGIQFASLFTVAMVLGRLVAGVVLRRMAWFPVLATCLLASASLALFGAHLVSLASASPAMVWHHAPLAAYVFPMVGFFIGPIYPVINSAVLSAVPVEKHGSLSALGVMISAGGSATGTVAVGWLFEHYEGSSEIYFALIPIFCLLACLLFFDRQTRLV